ncbi:hypothetical protein PAMP_000911 [Pampus punctatissimus]
MSGSVAAIVRPHRKVQRLGSIYEPLKLSTLQHEDEPLWEKLDHYYNAVKTTILNYQSPTTGLFPVKTCSTCKEAKVRDSLYCAAGAWALALAYRRIDDDMGRTHELEHSAIKCMRGILYCYMRQADKVEQFKQDPSPSKCLHSVFNVDTGDEVYSYNDYHHLQIDAVSLFLLYLVEMICSGLQIIYNTDEVSFIQNLVFCVERAYRVPDYGMWERGSKYNNGSTELHSSSLGLAKAALEAINGFNLFGNQGCSWSVIFVDLDAHNRNRQTLCSLLPRESRSHNTDAALLPTISYPAFAVDDDALYSQTLDKIVRKLRGKYGFKRFLRDGFRTANEDKNRRYYKPAEMKLFDGIECEFPIFFIYMMIDDLSQTVHGYRTIFKKPKKHKTSIKLIQMSKTKTQTKLAEIKTSKMDELISPKDIDPIHRYVPHQDQRNVSMRYSNQENQNEYNSSTVVGSIAFMNSTSEQNKQQTQPCKYNRETDKRTQIKVSFFADDDSDVSADIRHVSFSKNKKHIITVYIHVVLTFGPIENDVVIHVSLIAESQRLAVRAAIYRILGKTVVCYPIVFDLSDFYLSQDVMLLIDDIKLTPTALKHFSSSSSHCYGEQHCFSPMPLVFVLDLASVGMANITFRPQEQVVLSSNLYSYTAMLLKFSNLHHHITVLDTHLLLEPHTFIPFEATLISGAMVEQLDFLRVNEAEIPEFKSFEELELPKHSKVKRQMSTPNASELEQQPEISVKEWQDKPTHEIIQKFHLINNCYVIWLNYRLAVRHSASIMKKCASSIAPHITTILVHGKQDFCLEKFDYTKVGGEKSPEASFGFQLENSINPQFNLLSHLPNMGQEVKLEIGSPSKYWSVVRLAASLLTKLVDSLAPSITSVLVHGKQVTLGLFGHEEEVISNPLSPGVIQGIIYRKCSPHGGEREAVLQQELVIHIGWIISNNPELFSGMLKIRVGWIVQAMKHELKIRAGDMPPQDIYQISPGDIKQLLLDVLQPQHTGRSWLNRRQIDGSLNRTPLGFYDRVWQILERTPNGIVVAGTHLPQQPTLSDMTMYEMNFSLLVEDTLKNIVLPEYRQIMVELLMVVSIVLERNPELEFSDKVDLDSLVKEAFSDFQRDRSRFEGIEKQDDMQSFYNTPPMGQRGTSSYLTKAVMIQLLQGDVKPCKDDPCTDGLSTELSVFQSTHQEGDVLLQTPSHLLVSCWCLTNTVS